MRVGSRHAWRPSPQPSPTSGRGSKSARACRSIASPYDGAATLRALGGAFWGNSLGVRLPASVARAARLKADQRVRISVEDGRVIITPHGDKPLTLADRLALYDPELHGGEAMTVAALGREVW